MRRQYYLIAGSIAVLLLGACGGRSPEPAPTLEATAPPATAAPTPTSEPQPTPTETAITQSPICSPLAGHEIATLLSLYLTQPFIPPQGANKETGHHGLDFAYYSGGPTGGHINGTPIQSMLDGVVAGMGYNAVYGYYLIIETPFVLLPAELAEHYEAGADESLYMLYGHMQAAAPFAIGDVLACGQVVGQVGDSGSQQFTSDPHLHIETRVGAAGVRLAEMAYYTADVTEAQTAEYLRWRTSDEFRLMDPTILLVYTLRE
ncbi:MAG: M23 family metallopeptidase [Anaerolineales bacterium]|nr:M23 family metallopeptidase [Anaerolineales bacterium]